jgi:enoyl-CoA hydratase/carnithine racemase
VGIALALNSVPSLRVEIRERVGYVTFARPKAANTFTCNSEEFLAAAVRIESTPGMRATLMTGEGLGGDLRSRHAVLPQRTDDGYARWHDHLRDWMHRASPPLYS